MSEKIYTSSDIIKDYYDNLPKNETGKAIDTLPDEAKNKIYSVVMPLQKAFNNASRDGDQIAAREYVNRIIEIGKDVMDWSEFIAQYVYDVEGDFLSNYTDQSFPTALVTNQLKNVWTFDESLRLKVNNFNNDLVGPDHLRRSMVYKDDYKDKQDILNQISQTLYSEKGKSNTDPINIRKFSQDLIDGNTWKSIVANDKGWGLNFIEDVVMAHPKLSEAAINKNISLEDFNPENSTIVEDYIYDTLTAMNTPEEKIKNPKQKTSKPTNTKPVWFDQV
tara:strand:+ start:81 stop:911 length:831 start_codon:yes stop_codon:yes gene_type:complete